MPIKITMRGIEAVQQYLKTVPRGALKDALAAFTEYIVGNEQHGLKHADPYKYVSRAEAYPNTSFTAQDGHEVVGYSSLAQLQAVMAKSGGKQYVRTGESVAAWDYKPTNNGYGYTLTNPTAGEFYGRHDKKQANQRTLTGWRKVARVIIDNTAGAMRAANAAVKRRLAKKK